MNEIKNVRFVGFDRLKQSVSMHQVLERYGLLTQFRRSGDSLSGVCPLHRGSNPTQFRVSLDRNCWICFGDCQAGGSIIDFVSRMENVGVREAGLSLQDWFKVNGVNGSSILQRREPSPMVRSNAPLRYTLNRLNHDHPYLRQRGLTRQTVDTFGVGYCRMGFWRGWVVIPIHDRNGRPVAYAGRWPGKPQNGMPKYRMPRGFHKSLELYNGHRAAREDSSEPLVVVEGFWGCMHLWQAGHRKVVALMGSMLSRAQEQRLVELACDGPVLLLFDEDAAGIKGRKEACARLRRKVHCEILELPLVGLQPDSLEPWQLLELIQSQGGGRMKPPAEVKVVSLRECPVPESLHRCEQPDQAAEYWRLHIQTGPYFNPEVEGLYTLMLNTRRRVKGHTMASQGTMDTILVHPREVFRAAIVAAASAVIVMHNHPSGDPTPSEADIKVTRDLMRAGQLLKIELLDHIIIGVDRHLSLRELGYLYA